MEQTWRATPRAHQVAAFRDPVSETLRRPTAMSASGTIYDRRPWLPSVSFLERVTRSPVCVASGGPHPSVRASCEVRVKDAIRRQRRRAGRLDQLPLIRLYVSVKVPEGARTFHHRPAPPLPQAALPQPGDPGLPATFLPLSNIRPTKPIIGGRKGGIGGSHTGSVYISVATWIYELAAGQTLAHTRSYVRVRQLQPHELIFHPRGLHPSRRLPMPLATRTLWTLRKHRDNLRDPFHSSPRTMPRGPDPRLVQPPLPPWKIRFHAISRLIR